MANPPQPITRRVPVRTTGQTASLTPVAPSGGDVVSPNARAAAQLVQALGIGQGMAKAAEQRRYHAAELAGTKAAMEGRKPTPQEKQHDHFLMAYERVNTEHSLVQIRQELEQKYQALDKSTATPDEINKMVESAYKEHFHGLDPNNDVEAAMLPAINKAFTQIHDELMGRFQKDIVAADQQKSVASITEIARDDLKSGDHTLDYADIREKLASLFGRSKSNDYLVKIVGDLAVQEGRPDLLTNMPKMINGAAGPQDIPRLQDQFRNYVVQAEAQKEHDAKLAEAQAKQQHKQESEKTQAALVMNILGGHDQTAEIRAALHEGKIDADTARSLVNWQHTEAHNAGSGDVNDQLAQQLEIGLYTGKYTVTDIAQHAADIGTGDAGRAEVSRLLNLAAHVKTVAEQRLQTPAYKTYLHEIKTLLEPKKDSFGNPKPDQLTRQAESLRHYEELVQKGVPPLKARNEVMKAAHEAVSTTPATSKPQETPDELLKQLESGEITQDQFNNKMSALESQ